MIGENFDANRSEPHRGAGVAAVCLFYAVDAQKAGGEYGLVKGAEFADGIAGRHGGAS